MDNKTVVPEEQESKDLPYGDKPFIYAGNLTLEELITFLDTETKKLNYIIYLNLSISNSTKLVKVESKALENSILDYKSSQSIVDSHWHYDLNHPNQKDEEKTDQKIQQI